MIHKIPLYIQSYSKVQVRNRKLRQLLIPVISCLIILYITKIYFHNSNINNKEETVYEHHEYVSNDQCAIPLINPWDGKVKPYFKIEPRIQCGNVQPSLLKLFNNGTLVWNSNEIHKADLNSITCTYAPFRKSNKNDDHAEYGKYIQFTGYLQIIDKFIYVNCTKHNKEYFSNIYFVVQQDDVPKTSNLHKISNYPSIHIFLLDSASRANFIRQLPKTYSFLVSNLKAHVIKNMVSVSLSTITNVISLLMGIEGHLNEVGLPNCTKDYFDKCPFIWKNFSEIGYVTAFAEDGTPTATFNYLKKGFLKEPTDFYMRPFWVERNSSPLSRKSKEMCFGNIPNYQFLLQWITEFQEKINILQRPFFLMSISNQYSHDHFNRPQILDEPLSEFFRSLAATGNLNNTITIVMGDHGFRHGDYSMSTLGRREKVMPFFAISLPPWLKAQYPFLTENLKINENRLSSFFDVYDAMMDVIHQRWNKQRKQWSAFGHSLWYQIPKNRTCRDAGIPMELCPCNQEILVSINSPEVMNASMVLLNDINQIISPHPECEPLKLKRVVSAKRVSSYSGDALIASRHATYVLRIVIETLPGDALFEAILIAEVQQQYFFQEVNYKRMKNGFKVLKSIDRINRYNDQAHCVHDTNLRNYCYCTVQLST